MKKNKIVFPVILLCVVINCSYDKKVQVKENNLYIESGLYSKEESKYKHLNQLLSKYVQNGKVNYKGIKEDSLLNLAVQGIEKIPHDTLKTREENLAYWINVYNLYTIKLIVENYPLKSISELHLAGSLYLGYILNKTIWETYKFQLGSEFYTLNSIEHEILRKQLEDFRIHAAIVCASKSCPPLRSEAYSEKKINDQLDEQMKIFISQEEKNSYDDKTNILYLSKIFDWFKEDFSKNSNLLDTLKPYFPLDWKEKINSETKIKYTYYDWNLNE